jgi:hypothetical protein
MADNSVYITGADKGSLVDALDGLPPWATQKTAQDIEMYLKKSFDMQTLIFQQLKTGGSGGSGGSSAGNSSAKQASDDLDKLARTVRLDVEEYEKKKKRDKLLEQQGNDDIKRGKSLNTTGDKVDYVFGKISLAGNKLLENDKKYLSVYDSLYQSGINVLNGNNDTTDGFKALNQMVNETGQRMEVMQKTLEKYSTSVNVVGVNKFSKAIKASTDQLNAQGYYNENLNDLIGSLIESEKGYMNIRGKSAEEIASESIRFGSQVDKLSKTIGMSRDQILENNKQTSKSTETMIVTAKYGAEAGRNLALATAGIKDQGLRQTILELAASSNDMQVEGFRKLQAAGLGDYANQLSKFAKSLIGLSPVEAQKRLRDFSEQVENNTGRIANLGLTLDGVGGAAAATVNSIMQSGRDVTDASSDQDENAQKTQASLSSLNQQFEKTQAILQSAFYPMVEQVNGATAALKLFNTAAYGGINILNAETRSWIGAGVVVLGLISDIALFSSGLRTISSLFKGSGNILASAFETLGGSLGKMAARAGAVGGALLAGYEVGTFAYEHWLKDSETFQKGATSTFKGLDSILSFFGNDDAKKRLKVQEDADKFAAGLNPSESKKGEISVPKTPAPSTINSPSASPTTAPNTPDTSSSQSTDTPASSSSAIEKPSNNSNINSLLSYQSSIMEQLLQTSTTLLSVNRDILKFTRLHA